MGDTQLRSYLRSVRKGVAMKAQMMIVLDDDGKLSVATSTKNPFLSLGLLEAAKDVIKGQATQPESQIEIPRLVVPRT